MTVYTKEQEAEALAWVEKGTFCRLDLDVVLAMAKRTAEAEAKLEASRAGSERWHAVALESQQERDALKARVAELEAQVPWVALDAATRDVLATGRSLESVKAQAEKTGRSYILDKHHPPAITRLPSPTVVVTREAVEWLGAFLDTFAVWAQTDEGDDYARPLNAAAHSAVAIRKMLEVKP